MKLDPKEDGVSHINVWSRGTTDLGRDLSNFAHTPFVHPRYGPFQSVEGFWYWLSTGQKEIKLRHLWGYLAKEEGKVKVRITTDGDHPIAYKIAQGYGGGGHPHTAGFQVASKHLPGLF